MTIIKNTPLLSGFLNHSTAKAGDFNIKELSKYIISNKELETTSKSLQNISLKQFIKKTETLPKILTSGIVRKHKTTDDFVNSSYTGFFHFIPI